MAVRRNPPKKTKTEKGLTVAQYKRKAIMNMGATALAGVLAFAGIKHGINEHRQFKREMREFDQRQEQRQKESNNFPRQLEEQNKKEWNEYKTKKMREYGVLPNVMRFQPLTAENKNSFVADGWSEIELKRMTRYYSKLNWLGHIPFSDYKKTDDTTADLFELTVAL